ncbi:GT2 family glycosyltransferase [Humitalea rosea]|uniref:GT2 family glycosyltransferase n=1 Tax=Humitalea rosea TaxID=990373 RepID=A0A2W7IMT3_9PROT|nr:glycosyltransferase [Humitalea rosea]PZW48631.1 GT2 family glycosyltransferase [Humitalea rosea]
MTVNAAVRPSPEALAPQLRRQPHALLSLRLDARLRGSWAWIEVALTGMAGALALVGFFTASGTQVARSIRLGPAPGWAGRFPHRFGAICFLPADAAELRLTAVGTAAASVMATGLSCRPMPRWRAAARMLARRPAAVAGLVARPLPLTRNALRDRIRDVLAVSARAYDDQGHAAWVALFDTWTEADFPPPPKDCAIAYAVIGRAGAAALARTLQSLDAQYVPPVRVVLEDGAALRAAVSGLPADYIGILQAGETLPPHATAMAATELARLGRPDIAIADEDEITAQGERMSPSFKPTPNHMLMLSGTLSRGLWLVARGTLLDQLRDDDAGSAEAVRLGLWLRRQEAGEGGFSQRIPYILSHRHPETVAANPDALASVVAAHLARIGAPFTARPGWPVTLGLRDTAPLGRVTVIIPSTLRQAHCLECITAILRDTDYPDLDLHVAIAQDGPLDAAQEQAAAAIRVFPNATVTLIQAESFNFSRVNNQILARTQGEHVLLLNDDVSPIRADWLRWMVAFLSEPAVGIVGARLVYPNGTLQHGGVIMGLSEVCDHAHRGLPRGSPGYMSRAVLPQQVSAVTGACMLVRRSLLEQVGGLDEGYPSAFNDVDLALRIGELGYAVIYAPQAELWHLELQTYGSHYGGDRRPFYQGEVARMVHRWAGVLDADPFHNPNLSLDAMRHWEAAFPPRTAATAAPIAGLAERA